MVKPTNDGGLMSSLTLRFKVSHLEEQYKQDWVPRRFRDNIMVFLLLASLWVQSMMVDAIILPDTDTFIYYVKSFAVAAELSLVPICLLMKKRKNIEKISVYNMFFNITMVFISYISVDKSADGLYQSYFMIANLGGFALGTVPFIGALSGSVVAFIFYFIATIAIKEDPLSQILFGIFFIGSMSFLGGYRSYQSEWNERQVWRKRRQLEEAEKEITGLLNNILPPDISRRKRAGEKLIVDDFSNVTVLFADIVSFTRFSEANESRYVVSLLNTLFTTFDQITQRYGLEKIKTIGDCYMIAAGVPMKRVDHAIALAEVALEMIASARTFRHPDGGIFELRIGIHTGPVAAGVIGQTKFLYDIWGDTVNTASRLESHGMAGRIHVSDDLRQLLGEAFEFEGPFITHIKGKGEMKTWFLLGSRARAPSYRAVAPTTV